MFQVRPCLELFLVRSLQSSSDQLSNQLATSSLYPYSNIYFNHSIATLRRSLNIVSTFSHALLVKSLYRLSGLLDLDAKRPRSMTASKQTSASGAFPACFTNSYIHMTSATLISVQQAKVHKIRHKIMKLFFNSYCNIAITRLHQRTIQLPTPFLSDSQQAAHCTCKNKEGGRA